MKKARFLSVMLALLLASGGAQAQLGGAIRRAAQRGAEKAVEKKVEEKAVEEAGKVLDKAAAERQKGEKAAADVLDKAGAALDSASQVQAQADAKADALLSDIPPVEDTPYTPSESEFAFFAMKKGAVQTVALKDAKGKIQSHTRNTVKQIVGTKDAFAVEYQSEALDAKGQPVSSDNPMILNYRIVVSDGAMYLDMKNMFGAMDGLDGVEASGTAVKIPTRPQAGQTLGDAAAKVRIGFINCSAVITEGKVLAEEDLTVEAGTFHCYKISQKTNAAVMGIKSETTTVSWYAKGAGAVKSETFDKKGKLTGSTELISM
jgi:hypothetical protein